MRYITVLCIVYCLVLILDTQCVSCTCTIQCKLHVLRFKIHVFIHFLTLFSNLTQGMMWGDHSSSLPMENLWERKDWTGWRSIWSTWPGLQKGNKTCLQGIQYLRLRKGFPLHAIIEKKNYNHLIAIECKKFIRRCCMYVLIVG